MPYDEDPPIMARSVFAVFARIGFPCVVGLGQHVAHIFEIGRIAAFAASPT